jgi:hypothetical protein
MRHPIEIHVVETPADLVLAHTAGLLEDSDDTPFIISCTLCEVLIVLPITADAATPQAHIVLSDTAQAITCSNCLGLAIQTFMV